MDEMETKNPWLLRKVVLPQHTDHAGVMWHGSYLNWLEEARVNALANVGLSYADLSNSGFEMPVVDLKIKYMKTLSHGDKVILRSWSLEQKGTRLPWKTIFFTKDEIPTAEAFLNLVLLQRTESGFRISRTRPKHINVALHQLQKGPK